MSTPPDPEIPRAVNPATGETYVRAESVDETTDPTKFWWQSKILISVLVIVINRILGIVFKAELTDEDSTQIAQIVQLVIDAISTLVIVTSRMKGRSKPIAKQVLPSGNGTGFYMALALFAVVQLSSCAHVERGMLSVGLTWDEVLSAAKKAGLAAGRLFVIDFKDGVIDATDVAVDAATDVPGAKTPVLVEPLK